MEALLDRHENVRGPISNMPRPKRLVIPGIPHHLIQRGHRRQKVFFSDEDREFYLQLLKRYGDDHGLDYWAYCLMDNHVHLVAVPKAPDSLKDGLGQAHWKYSLTINARRNWRGHLWQARYDSYPMDDAHTFRAIRYAELNPVRAEIVASAEDFRWSSAFAHVHGAPDPLLARSSFIDGLGDWRAYLGRGHSEAELRLLRSHLKTGRPLGEDRFLDRIEELTGQPARKRKPGPKPRCAEGQASGSRSDAPEEARYRGHGNDESTDQRRVRS